MPSTLADARYWLQRLLGLAHRSAASLRTRGWRATWSRVLVHARPPAAQSRPALYLPAAVPFAPFTLPNSNEPRVSIIIPVYNQAAHTLACLRAIAAHPPQASIEVIVIDDGSSDQTVQWLPQIHGLRYEVRGCNGGFIHACNDGVGRSRGQYVVLLNNDTIPQPGWLDRLLETIEGVANAGLVGSQLLYPDGRLQESGAVLFSDGSAWSYGRFESATDPRYSALRDSHYCSGASVMLSRRLWDELGGLDTRYCPAYYEDADLAMRVRQRGLRVLVQPASQVVHDEGTSHGTDVRSGLKAHQLRNQHTFARHWQAQLASHPAPGSIPGPGLLHQGQAQVLIIDETLPQPDRDSASLRQTHLLQLLSGLGAHVVMLSTSAAAGDAGAAALRRAGVETWPAASIGSLGRWLAEHGKRFDSIMLVRHHLAQASLPLVRKYAPQARILFDTVDLHYLREARGAEVANDPALRSEAARTRKRELAVMAQADITVLVSAAEQAQLRTDAPQVRTALISNLHQPQTRPPGREQRKDIVFVGGFGHPPNTDAVLWLLREIFPLIQPHLPRVQLHLIGQDPPASVMSLAAGMPQVTVHGYVADIAPYMDGCRLAVAPLRFGAGVKGKVNLSMAHGQPVVATSCAAEGMHLQHGHDVLIADDAAGFAAAVIALYNDQVLWQQLAQGGLENIRQHFSLEAARRTVAEVFLP
ncbi:glycosyl transferase [Stenotrophomonas ginsengisoli]|uniref:Glycosyl transferase n=1 Tax=Stenotrophomonas ginsengisoli TaxID=336566 RepID=A0A0R0DP25_9GAMM|nr:glycosyltransferase [Stenotrophomonas ginsengisoli]KRG79411.1 glycosyl transferase [Stenotrophomonas ginsengisoli]